jgi:hypothetical protein
LLIDVGNSYAGMNERLIRGESNTNMPFPANGESSDPQQPMTSQQHQAMMQAQHMQSMAQQSLAGGANLMQSKLPVQPGSNSF